MNWLVFALSAQFLYALVNHLDKYLLGKFFKGGVGAMMIFTAMVNAIFLPIILILNPQILSTPWDQALLVTSIGGFYVIGALLYLYALRIEETTKISVLWQLSAPITYFLGIIFLGELLNFQQTLGAIIVLIGGLLTMIHIERGKFRIKKKVLTLMFSAVLLFSSSSIIFKVFAINFDFWSAVFFEILGAMLTGIVLILVVPNYRRQFLSAIKKDSLKVFSYNLPNEYMQMSATILFRYATMIAPLALVQVTNSINAIFVFLIAVIIAKFLPRISEEKFNKVDIFQKVLGIIVVTIGIILIEI